MPDKKLRVMISSRCNDPFPEGGSPLSDLRRAAKRELEAVRLFGKPMFDVWINEDAPPDDAAGDSIDICLAQVDEADIVVVLSNGNAGWAAGASDIGICHAELMRGVATAAGKVRLVALLDIADDPKDPSQIARNARFREYLQTQNFFRGGSVRTRDDALERIREAVFDAVQSLARLGVREARKGKFHTGEALQWSSLNFRDRQALMVDTLAECFAARPGGKRVGNRVELPVAGKAVLFAVHAIPAALTIAAARELVGQPFLRDFEYEAALAAAAGPVHVIGCQKGATESQAIAMLGFPDATVVAAPFGVYVADPLQKVQFLFLQNCRDRTTTRFSAQRFFDWIDQSGEAAALLACAQSRRRIVKAIAREQEQSGSAAILNKHR